MPRLFLDEQTQFIASLFEVPQELEHASLSEFLVRIVQRCEKWFDASSVSLFLVQTDPKLLELAASCGEISSVPREAVIEVGNGIAGIAVAEGVPALINDAEFQPKFRALVGRRAPTISSMIVPLVSSGSVTGVLNVARALGKHQFNGDDLNLAKSIAGHLALAVENARLVANLQSAVEELERHRAESDRLNRLAEIGQLTAAIAHEIRNPLTGIRSAAQMIQEDAASAKEFAAIIEEETGKLNDLCSEFLAFAKPIELRVDRLDLGQLGQRVLNLLAHEFKAKGVQSSIQISNDLPIIEGDSARWEQVLQNLLLNALQATESGGRVELSVTKNGFFVEDTGTGMSPEQVDRLFSPFYTTKAQGTGLGLSTIKKIVDAHGAMISVQSESGRGTRFTIEFETRKAA